MAACLGRRTLTWIAISTLLSRHVAAQTLAFTEPAANALTVLSGGIEYEVGKQVMVQWRSEFEQTTLRVFQGPLGDGSYALERLADAVAQSTTSYTWTAGAIGGADLTYPFHFELVNTADGTCDNCTTNSVNFAVTQRNQASTTTSSSSSVAATSSLATSASIPTTTTSTTSGATLSGAAAGSNSNGNSAATAISQKSNNHDLAIGLGVGLGVGLPVLFAILGLLIFCAMRRRRQNRASTLPRGRQPPQDMHQITERNSDTPLVEPQPAYVPPPRTSYARSSRYSTGAGSRASSFFEPFEFERPGSQEFDTRSVMSEITTASSGRRRSRLGSIREHERPPVPQRTSMYEHEVPPLPPQWPLTSQWPL